MTKAQFEKVQELLREVRQIAVDAGVGLYPQAHIADQCSTILRTLENKVAK